MVAWRVNFERVEKQGDGDYRTVDVPYDVAIDEAGAITAARGISVGLVVPDTGWAPAGSETVMVSASTYLSIAEWVPTSCELKRLDLLTFGT